MSALEDAIEANDISKFMEVLESEPGPLQTELDEALTLALDPCGDIRAMILLLSHGAKVTRNSFSSPFIRNDLVAWQAFIDYRWEINSVEFRAVALRSVATNEEHVKWFLDHNADPNLRGIKDPDALFYTIEPNNGGLPVMAYLIDKGTDVNLVQPKRAWKGCGPNSGTRLLHAIKFRSKERVEFLLQRGADKTLNPDSTDSLAGAAKARGCPEIFELLSS
ncbi:hypothetical protein BDZ45DRAFT_730325 [Acephala macrosclerotiorum]|nr:hypothetical protein BDZ45DRAFT_730325 [Acephala macrosclerotiorum]